MLYKFNKIDVAYFEKMIQTGELDISYSSKYGDTLLHYAALKGNLNIVEKLLELGADV
ncbi:MAG: ankyrin repeat domain-containing protein, partial [Thermoguttaceae bacterium]|nr:ankyrin repeat domain-containing protein [Thermoguttaceae bacterium]